MRRIRFAMLLLAVLGATPLVAQEASYDVTASISISQSLSWSLWANMSFGSVHAQALTATINPQTHSTAGKLRLNAHPGSSLAISWTAPTHLTMSSTGATVAFSDATVSAYPTDAQPSSVMIVQNGAVTTDASTGYHFFWLGGTATFPSSQAAGTYTGTLTVTATYIN